MDVSLKTRIEWASDEVTRWRQHVAAFNHALIMSGWGPENRQAFENDVVNAQERLAQAEYRLGVLVAQAKEEQSSHER